MKLQIITKNVEASEAIGKQINKKIGKLNHYLPSLDEGKVEISQKKSREPEHKYTVQVTLDSKGTVIRAYEEAADIPTAIDKVMDVLNKRIERYKGKKLEKRRGVSQTRQELSLYTEESSISPEVVKSKRFLLKPMSIDEAKEQLELLGHDFFIFIEAETSMVNLLYRRKDRNYGVIVVETEQKR
jgi:putative sigma-54 modulation protein